MIITGEGTALVIPPPPSEKLNLPLQLQPCQVEVMSLLAVHRFPSKLGITTSRVTLGPNTPRHSGRQGPLLRLWNLQLKLSYSHLHWHLFTVSQSHPGQHQNQLQLKRAVYLKRHTLPCLNLF